MLPLREAQLQQIPGNRFFCRTPQSPEDRQGFVLDFVPRATPRKSFAGVPIRLLEMDKMHAIFHSDAVTITLGQHERPRASLSR